VEKIAALGSSDRHGYQGQQSGTQEQQTGGKPGGDICFQVKGEQANIALLDLGKERTVNAQQL
jgi:hypothetical protein